MYQSNSGYLLYVILLFLVSGAAILLSDARNYKEQDMRREGKYAFFLGWLNVLAGLGIWAGGWAFSLFFQ
ncbi:CLC_0170 family protein [Paenibacillus sp.]|uniref:CLC_0170 family protein n=1 Tax=Paenibacillus sp. TaxID=58172 RepID=UPI002D60CD39|nr:CLC_0170 family protein [Paenibacillus sp.]HZG54863.1 CLC_0170 family protein [Paenibacillus sp.]